MTCILGCKRNEGIPFCPFSNSTKNESEGMTTITWKSMTIPQHYFLVENFWECTNRETKAVPPLGNMCCIEILSNLHNFRWDLLPLPKPILNKLRNICKMVTHKDECMGERRLSTWVMSSCGLYTIIGQFDVEQGCEEDSCPIQWKEKKLTFSHGEMLHISLSNVMWEDTQWFLSWKIVSPQRDLL